MVESEAISQVVELCNQEFTSGSTIRIMPDVHAGKGCTIGTTMTIEDKVVPNLVGVDIGCGMLTIALKEKDIDLSRLDAVIRNKIPSGFNVRSEEHRFVEDVRFKDLRYKCKDIDRIRLSLGTLGGGNHFIELGRDKAGKLLLVIHTGSRNLGKQVADYYQDKAYENIKSCDRNKNINDLVNELKLAGRESEIEKEIRKLKELNPPVTKDFAYCEGDLFEDYINDMGIVQEFANLNREAIADEIISNLRLEVEHSFTTMHNYIELDSMILRKGAIRALQDELVLIPMNMRDGSLLCKGKGNKDWNYSAPHGAGRLMSRGKAKETFNLEEFTAEMAGIYSTSVVQSTIDECPMAYKPMEDIINNIGDTVEILDVIKPIYNYKNC